MIRLLSLIALAGMLAGAQEQSPRKLIPSLAGNDLFQAYCASCHGADAKGQGPVASALKALVPDLTTLAKRRQGKFPATDLEKIILGEADSRLAHGSRQMPVWGPVFRRVEEDQDLGLVRVRRLVEFIRSKQVK
ncbi:MAG: cytochrome c [Bryobacteraceae bacterium]|nr:cytochrome c [Bryobacteraceae bacterium]